MLVNLWLLYIDIPLISTYLGCHTRGVPGHARTLTVTDLDIPHISMDRDVKQLKLSDMVLNIGRLTRVGRVTVKRYFTSTLALHRSTRVNLNNFRFVQINFCNIFQINLKSRTQLSKNIFRRVFLVQS